MLIALEVYNPAGTLVYEQSYDTQSFAAGERRAYAVDWTVPPTEPLGVHTVRVGVFSPGWGTVVHWNDERGRVHGDCRRPAATHRLP